MAEHAGQPDRGKSLFLAEKEQGSWERNLSWCQKLSEGINVVMGPQSCPSCGLSATVTGDDQ